MGRNKKGNKGRVKTDKIRRALERGILRLLEDNPKKSYNYKQLAAAFEVNDPPTRQTIISILADLTIRKYIKEVGRGSFSIVQSTSSLVGRIEITRRGSGYVIIEGSDDVFIPTNKTNTALNGDQVEVRLNRRQKGSKLEGTVVRIVERGRKQYVGTFEENKGFGFVVPDDKFLHVHFYIPEKNFGNAKHGDKVVCKITQWIPNTDSPLAEITQVLGRSGEHNAEMHAILAAYDLPSKFDDRLEQIAENIPEEITEKEISKRRDMRDTLTFTIDPDDAKDFDDALSLKTLENGNFEVGVHIADVSHYVQPGDPIDKEAYTRATSVYLVDRVVPMLPEKLSNGICSLRPNEDKLCYAVIFEIDNDAKVIDYSIEKTVIHSNRRFTYEEAQERVENKKGDLHEEINTLDRLAKILRKERMSHGALEIESTEVKFKLDEKGVPVGVFQKVSKDANKLIEEFMLLANKHVSMTVGKPKNNKTPKPFIYRVHEPPNPEKLERLVYFLNHIGISISNLTPENCTKSLNTMFKNMEDKQEVSMIKTMAIRTMSKAEYSTDPIGHYGLSFKYYSHFTSPIRRYPDLIAHRLLFQYLEGGQKYTIDLDDACNYTSMRERVAAEAERESIKYKQVEYLSDRVGLVFSGIVSGMNANGIFVELTDSRCEGMVKLISMADDHYEFDEKAYVIRGRKYHKEYFLGDDVEVVVKKVDMMRKQVDMEFVDPNFQ